MSSRRFTPKRQATRQSKGYQRTSTAETALIRKELARMVEPKNVDTSIDLGTITSSGVIVQLNSIAQGSANNERIGDSVKYKSLTMRLRALEITAGGGTYARFVIALWVQNSTPTAAQILEYSGSDSVLVSPKDWDYRKQCKILYDSGCVTVQASDTDASGNYLNTSVNFNSGLVVIPLTNLGQVQYENSSSTASNNRLYFIRWTDGAGANNVSTKAVFRLTYTDV